MLQRRMLPVVVAAVVAAALLGCGESDAVSGERARGIEDLPQRNVELGSAGADAVATLYADPACASEGCFDLGGPTLDRIIERFVRPGRLRLTLRPVTTPGYPERGVREAFAASLQDRMWSFVLTYWANQQTVEDPDRIAAGTPGLDIARLRQDLADPRIPAAATRAKERAERRRAAIPSLYFDGAGDGNSDVRRIPLTDDGAALRVLDRLMRPGEG